MRPFRDPHHTASTAALVGGGAPVAPGEVTLAHHGVLFLDELPEFRRDALEALREPLESSQVVIARVNQKCRLPASFQFVAAMNPCPSGFVCDEKDCRCTPQQIHRYRSRLSGPLLDRIDLTVEVAPVTEDDLWNGQSPGLDEADSRQKIEAARAIQLRRNRKYNRELDARDVERHCALDTEGQERLRLAIKRHKLSARAIHRVQKVARTIADLAEKGTSPASHVAQALEYRADSSDAAGRMRPKKERRREPGRGTNSKEFRNLDAASAKLEAEANKLDAEARKLEAEVRNPDQSTNTDAFKLGLAAFATILAAVKVADALGWL